MRLIACPPSSNAPCVVKKECALGREVGKAQRCAAAVLLSNAKASERLPNGNRTRKDQEQAQKERQMKDKDPSIGPATRLPFAMQSVDLCWATSIARRNSVRLIGCMFSCRQRRVYGLGRPSEPPVFTLLHLCALSNTCLFAMLVVSVSNMNNAHGTMRVQALLAELTAAPTQPHCDGADDAEIPVERHLLHHVSSLDCLSGPRGPFSATCPCVSRARRFSSTL